ncbi:MAG TPA: outer membrane protein assembly factor BamE [Paenirhodobacter sp.]
MLVVALFVAGCQAIYRDHGYVPTERELAQVVVGKSTREDVATAIGRPSSTGVLEGSGWYYVGSRWRHFGPRAPQEIDRQVVAVSFGANGMVSNVERYGLDKGEVVVLSRRVTESNIKGVSVIGQLLGNIGRMNASQLVDSPRN